MIEDLFLKNKKWLELKNSFLLDEYDNENLEGNYSIDELKKLID
ncbi:hypothetical protein ['Camptotheca acuminata' phytoplasma]